MGWYAVAEALQSGDADRLARVVAQEIEPDRSLSVARSELTKRGLMVHCAECGAAIYLKQPFERSLTVEELGAATSLVNGKLVYYCPVLDDRH